MSHWVTMRSKTCKLATEILTMISRRCMVCLNQEKLSHSELPDLRSVAPVLRAGLFSWEMVFCVKARRSESGLRGTDAKLRIYVAKLFRRYHQPLMRPSLIMELSFRTRQSRVSVLDSGTMFAYASRSNLPLEFGSNHNLKR